MTRSLLRVPALLGDAFYLLLHDKSSGRPHLAPRITHLSLGAAMLCELFLAGLIGIQPRRGHEGVVVLPERYPVMPDLVQHLTLTEIETEAQPPSVWMRMLGPLVTEPIAERLERAGYHDALPVPVVGLPFGFVITRPKRWRPESPLAAETPALHLDGLLQSHLRLQLDELALVGLTYACGLHRYVFPFATKAIAERVAREVTELPHPLPDVIRELNTAVNRIVTTARH
jgi:hypothetical protein